MSKVQPRSLGSLARLVEKEPRFESDRQLLGLVVEIVSGLRKMREGSKLSQTELGERLGVTQGRISQIESGLLDHVPSIEMIARYAAACGGTVRVSFAGAKASAKAA